MHQSHRVAFNPKSEQVSQAFANVWTEIDRSCEKHPAWPVDLLHADQIINEEKGEATRAALQYVYEGGSLSDYREELIQTAAMAIKQLIFLHTETFVKGPSFDPVANLEDVD